MDCAATEADEDESTRSDTESCDGEKDSLDVMLERHMPGAWQQQNDDHGGCGNDEGRGGQGQKEPVDVMLEQYMRGAWQQRDDDEMIS